MTDGPDREYSAEVLKAARTVARERGLPWGLSLLRQHGYVGELEAKVKSHSDVSGAPFHQFAEKYIHRAADRGAEKAEALPPSTECIEEALKTFTEED